jgi:hypothetical protein
MSSTFNNVNISFSSYCPSNIVVLLVKVSHNVSRVLHEQVTWAACPWLHAPCTNELCKGKMISFTRYNTCTNELCGSQRVIGSEHPKRGPLCQRIETYKMRHLESIKGIDSSWIVYFLLSLFKSVLGIPHRAFLNQTYCNYILIYIREHIHMFKYLKTQSSICCFRHCCQNPDLNLKI